MTMNQWSHLIFVPVAAIVMPAHAVNYLSVAEAQQQMFDTSHQFVEAPLSFTDEDKDQIKELAGVRQRTDEQKFWKVKKDGELVGWFAVDDVIGKHEYITYGVALDLAGNVLDVEILSYRETHGHEVRNAVWREQFVGKSINDSLKLGKDIENISGATLSCRNVTDGIKRLLVINKLFLTEHSQPAS